MSTNPCNPSDRKFTFVNYIVIDETMKTLPTTLTSTGIRCFKKRCTGIIASEVDLDNNEIHWKCSKCRNNGTITGWQGTQCDNYFIVKGYHTFYCSIN